MLAAALWLLLACPASAQRASEIGFTVDQWGGVNTYNDSARISDFDAQDARNVLTDRGFLEVRPGIVKSTSVPSGSVRALGHYAQSETNRYLIIHSTGNIYRSDFGTSLVTIATVSAGSSVSMVPAFLKMYVADGVGRLIEYDGTSSSTISGSPICRHLEFGYERIWCAAIPDESESRVRISSYGGAGYWVVPDDVSDQPDASNSFDFQKDDGGVINCMMLAPWGMVVGKDTSLHIIKGDNNSNFKKMVISPTVGCMDNRTMKMHKGKLTWLARDGVYEWPGAGPPDIISRDIDNQIKGIKQLTGSGRSGWSVNTNADWQQGSSDSNNGRSTWDAYSDPGYLFPSSQTFLDTSSTTFSLGVSTNIDLTERPGSIQVSSSVVYENFADGDYTAGITSWTVSAGAWTVSGGFAYPSSHLAESSMYTTSAAWTSSYWGGNKKAWKWSWKWSDNISPGYPNCNLNASNCFATDFAVDSSGNYYTASVSAAQASGAGTGKTLSLSKTVGGVTTSLGSASVSYSASTVYTFTILLSTDGVISVSDNIGNSVSATDYPLSITSSIKQIVRGFNYNVVGSQIFNYVTNISGYEYKSSATYVSRIFDTGSLHPIAGTASISLSSATDSPVSFWVRSSTSQNNDMWSSLSASSGGVKAPNLNRYYQYIAQFNSPLSSKTARLDDYQILFITTGVYNSYVKTIQNPAASWEQILLSGSVDTNLMVFLRGSASPFSSSDASPSWVQQSVGSVISISTGVLYLQFRVDSSSFSSSTQTATLDRFYAQWLEGLGVPMAAGSFEQRYFICAAFGATADTNDECWVYQRNKKWVPMTGPTIGALDIFDGIFYGGNSAGTDIWKLMQEGVYNDDGDAIDSYWVSKDFMFSPNGQDWATGEKVINELWLDAESSTGTIMNAGYAVNKSSTRVSGTLDLGAYGDSVNKMVNFSGGYGLGKYFNFKFSNAQADKTYKIFGYSIYGEAKPRTQD